jgi:alanyl-tRNA synthetase
MKFGNFSTELCGGTHVARTGDIGLFKIVSEGGVAAGIRRIEAVTGEGALKWVDETAQTLNDLAALVRASRDDVGSRVKQLVERNRALEKDIEQLRAKLASGQGMDLTSQAVAVGKAKVLAARLDGADSKALRDAVDQLKNKLGSAAVVLGTVEEGKVRLVAGVTKDLTGKLPAGELVNAAAQKVGGKGGGRPDMAQAGGSEPEGLDAALDAAKEFASSRLG